MSEDITQVTFVICAAGIFYVYVGYPVLVMLLARMFGRDVIRTPFTGSVSILIAVNNDSMQLVPKLKALMRIRTSERIAEVLIGSDGSTDGVASAMATVDDPRIKLVEFSKRRGKSAVLNDLMCLARSEIIIMMDARQILRDNALENLMLPFADPSVGVVSGHLVLNRHSQETAGTKSIGSYWDYEKMIRRAEARFSSVPGATGALYAIRKDLLHPIPPQTILDDVAIPMQAIARGSRCIFEDSAICDDEPSSSIEQEQIRKRRTIAGCIQLAILFPKWLLPWRNPIWLQFVSHKILRLFSPFLLAGLLASSALLIEQKIFVAAFMLQLFGYLLAWAGWISGRAGLRWKVASTAFVFVAMNITVLRAWIDALQGRFTAAWERSVKS